MKGSILTFATVIKLSFWLLSPTLSAPSTPSLSVTISSLISQYLRYYCKTSFNSPSLRYYQLPQLSVSQLLWASSTLRLSATMRSLNSLSLRYYQLLNLPISPSLRYYELPQLSISITISSFNSPSLRYYQLLQLSISPRLSASSTLHISKTISSFNSPSLQDQD